MNHWKSAVARVKIGVSRPLPPSSLTQSIIYVPLQVIIFYKSILLIVQYNYLKSCSEDFLVKNLILRIRSCGTAFITQHSWLIGF